MSISVVAPSGDATGVTDTAAIVAAAPGVVNLLSGTYYWIGGTQWPLDLNACGQGFSAVGAPGQGTTISTTNSSIIVQALGASRATVIQGIDFANGFQVRKLNTTFINCRTVGFIVGDNGTACAPYYTKTVAHRFEAPSAGTAISFQNGASGTNLQGSLLVPSAGRGIDCTSGSMFGNYCEMTVDLASALPSIGAVLYFSGASFDNQFEFQYLDSSFIGPLLQDGAHIVFGNGAYNNRVHVHSTPPAAGLRVYNKQTTTGLQNFVDVACSPREQYQFSDFTWAYNFSDKVHANSAISIYMPPSWLRCGRLEFEGDATGVSAFASSYVIGATVNTSGSGGTPGIYYQDIMDSNTVFGHGCTVKITIDSTGKMTAPPTVLYPGWQKSNLTLAATVPISVGSLVGGIINLSSNTEYQAGGEGQFNPSIPIADLALSTFSNEATGGYWVCYPGFPPNNVHVAGNTGATPVPDLKYDGLNQSWTLSANATWGAPINQKYIGQQLTLFVVSSGAFTTAWNAIYRNAPAWGVAANGKRATALFRWDGASWQFVGGSSAFA